jgi:hypothetical protein
LKFNAGVYVYEPSAARTIEPPCVVAKVPAVTVNASPSKSVSFASKSMLDVNTVSSVALIASSTATGASLTAATVIVNCPTSVSAPSVTV